MNDFNSLMRDVKNEMLAVRIPVSDKISPVVHINTRAKKRFGQCIFRNGMFTIELSAILLEAPERSCRQTLAHELIHTCKGCDNHGAIFKKYAQVMNRTYGYNIKCTNTAEEMGVAGMKAEPKYIIECTSCGKRIGRDRRSKLTDQIWRYRCRCGGTLRVVKPSA